MHKKKLEKKIELLRQEMIEKLLMSMSYQSDDVLGASQALDRVLNCYDCVRYERACDKKPSCESIERTTADYQLI